MANLELGAQLPAWHWDLGVSELRDWAQGVEAIGYQWLGITDHVLYAYATETRAEAPYAGGTIQHEPLTFLAWVAGFTQRVALTTSVVVLPQRQAALVAKQAAEVDILSGGRLRLGVGQWLAGGRVRGAADELRGSGATAGGGRGADARLLAR